MSSICGSAGWSLGDVLGLHLEEVQEWVEAVRWQQKRRGR